MVLVADLPGCLLCVCAFARKLTKLFTCSIVLLLLLLLSRYQAIRIPHALRTDIDWPRKVADENWGDCAKKRK